MLFFPQTLDGYKLGPYYPIALMPRLVSSHVSSVIPNSRHMSPSGCSRKQILSLIYKPQLSTPSYAKLYTVLDKMVNLFTL